MGKSGSGSSCWGTTCGRGKPARLQHLQHRRPADAVQGRVDDGEVARPVAGERRRRCRGSGRRSPRRAPCRPAPRGDRRQPARRRRSARRSPRRRAARSGAVAEVDLVAVVLGRVVAGGHHHPRDARRARGSRTPAAASGSGRGSSSARSPAPVITSAVSAAKTSELWRASYPITTRAAGGRAGVAEVRRQPGRRAEHDDAVHPVGPGAERAAQPGGAELQRPVEAVCESSVVGTALDRGDERLELGPGRAVGVLLGPGRGPGASSPSSIRAPYRPGARPPAGCVRGRPACVQRPRRSRRRGSCASSPDTWGPDATVALCVDLLRGADRRRPPRRAALPDRALLRRRRRDPRPAVWKDYWVRTWGARGLLHVWAETATGAVVAGLDDEEWRPAEMCLKVATAPRGRGRRRRRGARSPATSCRGCARRRCARWARSATPSTSTRCGPRATTRQRDVRRQAAGALERLAERLDLPEPG